MTINWRRRGTCASPDQQPDMWFAPDVETRRLACHICLNHCPVLNECHEDAKNYPYKGVVAGGIIWSEANGRPVTRGRGPGQLCTICHDEIKKGHHGYLHGSVYRKTR